MLYFKEKYTNNTNTRKISKTKGKEKKQRNKTNWISLLERGKESFKK